jgi:CubicO group peptidase (beta-lactamase class C family)
MRYLSRSSRCVITRLALPAGLLLAAGLLGGCPGLGFNDSVPGCDASLADQPAPDLAAQLETWRAAYNLPALGAAIVRGDGTTEYAAVGRRRAEVAGTCVMADDLFHLGSNTKAMTATMLGALVEDGVLSWDTTLAEVFPELAEGMHADFRTVTLRQLLAHRAGLPDDRAADADVATIAVTNDTPTEQRVALLRIRTAVAPTVPPGSQYIYANAGYNIAAAMAEKLTGQTYRALMDEHVFGPLGMAAVGFGAPGSADVVDQPWGHAIVGGRLISIPPGPEADNPPVAEPSGGAHSGLADWAKFAAAHLRGAAGKDGVVTAATFADLQTPAEGEDYVGGWVVETTPGLGKTLVHTGSNTLWFAVIYVLPDVDLAVLVATNRADDAAQRGVIEVSNALAREGIGGL